MSMRMFKDKYGKEEKRLDSESKNFSDVIKEECRSWLYPKGDGLGAKGNWLWQCPKEAILM
jgi:hypothetical protein